MSGEDKEDKQHDPSQRKLEEARRQGDVPRSAELTTAAAYGGLLLACALAGPSLIARLGSLGMTMLAAPARPQDPVSALSHALMTSGLLVLPLLALPGAAALISLIAQRGLVFAPRKLAPKASRISPLATARQKFGAEGLAEFAKSALRMAIIAGLMVWQMRHDAEALTMALQVGPAQSAAMMLRLVAGFLLAITLATAALGAIDLVWQHLRHRHRNRMSRQELTDEAKDSEGDPHIRSQRRQRAREVATNRMLQDVGRADVIIVNPTHYAVALRWKRGDRQAPVCVAKGVDEVAARIRARAAEAGIPLHHDPPTARALHATVRLGQPIRPEHYRAVAAAIRFAEGIRRKRRG